MVHVCTLLPCSEHVMLEHCMSHTSSFCAAEQVLHQFQDRFIDEVDADSIVFDLKCKDIIPGGLVTAIRQRFEPTQQNQLLYEHLEKACDEDALMTVCNIMISFKGHPKMNKLGKDMKSMLQGKRRERGVHAWF